MKETPHVILSADNPEPYELVAASIIKIAGALDQMSRAGLSRRAMCVLLKDATRVSMDDIDKVLSAAPRLRGLYLTKVTK